MKPSHHLFFLFVLFFVGKHTHMYGSVDTHTLNAFARFPQGTMHHSGNISSISQEC